VIEVVRDGPAFAAGIDAGDIVTAVDGRSVTAPGQFRAGLFRKQAGEDVTLTVRRGGEIRQITLTLAPRP